jgi:hypothetical protein
VSGCVNSRWGHSTGCDADMLTASVQGVPASCACWCSRDRADPICWHVFFLQCIAVPVFWSLGCAGCTDTAAARIPRNVCQMNDANLHPAAVIVP